MAQLLVDVLAENRQKRRFLLHDFVMMPNHFHLLLTPAADIPLHHHIYLWENPVRAGLSERPELFAWSSASLGIEVDPPPGLKP
jgi:REP element-mobilizing transposase RayT